MSSWYDLKAAVFAYCKSIPQQSATHTGECACSEPHNTKLRLLAANNHIISFDFRGGQSGKR